MTQGVLLDMQLESIVGNNKVEIYAYIFIHELGLRGQALSHITPYILLIIITIVLFYMIPLIFEGRAHN
mgnify:CR=1 FL=1